MSQDVATIRGSVNVAEAVQLMRLKGLRALIVEPRHDGDAYGIVTETDIAYKVVAHGKDPQRTHIYDIMTKPCVIVNLNSKESHTIHVVLVSVPHCEATTN